MTDTVPDDSVGLTADQQTHRPDELEDWLTDLRINLNDDPPGWLIPISEDDTTDPATDPAPVPTAASSTEDHAVPDAETPAQPEQPDGKSKDDRPSPAVGRHRAAE